MGIKGVKKVKRPKIMSLSAKYCRIAQFAPLLLELISYLNFPLVFTRSY